MQLRIFRIKADLHLDLPVLIVELHGILHQIEQNLFENFGVVRKTHWNGRSYRYLHIQVLIVNHFLIRLYCIFDRLLQTWSGAHSVAHF